MAGPRPGSSNPRSSVEALEHRTLFAATLPAGFQESVWASGLNTPTAQAFAPDGRLFVLEKGGNVRVVSAAGMLLTQPFLSVATDINQDRGLVGLAFDPAFQQNGYLYVYYTNTDGAGSRNRLSRFTADAADANRAAASSERVLLEVPHTTFVHTGGAMAFGADGMLYLGVGDGGVASAAQDLGDLRGKVLRLNVANPSNLVPADNPHAGMGGARGEIWALGFRNPFSGAMQPGTNTFYVNDVGEAAWEEVNRVTRNGNYGWPLVEGVSSNPAYVNPVYAYAHGSAPNSAVTGGAFYNGTQFPGTYAGSYFFADYVNGWIRRLDGSGVKQEFATNAEGPLDIDVGPDGSLYYLSAFGNGFSGTNRPVLRISCVGTGNRAPEAVIRADPTSGAAPLTVNLSAASSSDPDGDPLTYAWDFGDGTTATGVTVSKTYAAAGTYTARLTASDGRGGTDAADPVTITVGNNAPAGTIVTPSATTTYAAGQTIGFSGTATDPEEGTLPASAFSWRVLLVHNTHTHDMLGEIAGTRTGSFTVPRTGHVESNQSYRIELTVADSTGLRHVSTRGIQPQVSTVTLQTVPAGLAVALDAQPRTAPAASPSLVGATRSISAPPRQTLNGAEYEFVSWSDGGSATHDVTVPSANTTYTATYRLLDQPQAPFGGAAAVLPGTVQAEHFDEGGAGVAYHDLTAANEGGVYRNAAVDLEDTTDAGGGYNVGYVKAGEWLEYTVDVANSGAYAFDARVASLGAGGNFRLFVDGVDRTGVMTVPDTGGWQAWQTVRKGGITLDAGRHVLRVAVESEGPSTYAGNFNHFTFSRTDPPGVEQALPAVADAYVRDGGLASSNFGCRTNLVVKNSSAGLNRQSLLRFDLSGFHGPVASAKLRLFGRLENATATMLPVDVYGTSAAWNEATVNWNTRPVVTTARLATQRVRDVVNRWYEWDVTEYVRAEQAAGRQLVSLLLINPARTVIYTLFNSREAAADRPQLVVNGQSDPAAPVVVSVDAADGDASEGGNTGTLRVTRTGDTTLPLTVNLSAGGTATSGVDYNGFGTSVTIPAGSASASVLVVPRDDSASEGTETVVLTLQGGAGYTVNAASASASVRLFDNDTPAGTERRTGPSADAYVRDGTYATSSLGSSADLIVKRASHVGLTRESLLKFALDGLTSASVGGAKLRVFGQLQDTRAANVPVEVYGTATGWPEANVTWATRPADATPRLATANVPDATARWYEWDVTSYVRQELAAGRNLVSLLLRSGVITTPHLRFNAREAAANRPELVIVTAGDPPPPPTQTPFSGTPVSLPGTVQAENYDRGGEGVAFHDTDSVNEGGVHRTDGVDVEATTDAGGGHNLGWVKAGEWMEYTVELPAGGGVYNLEFRVASGHPGGTFHVEFDGVDVTGPLRLSYTGDWQNWQTVTKAGVTLPGGRHVMRLSIDSSDNGGDVGNINWVRVVPGTSAPSQTVNWANAADVPLAREEGQGAVVNNKLYVFGGFHTSGFLASDRVDVYDPATNTWSARRAMPERITHGATVVDGQTVWIVGGYVGDNPAPGTNHVWKYDAASDTWSRGPDLPAARGGGAAGIVGRVIYFFGGRDGARTSDRGETWALDLNAGAAAQWVARAPMPNPRNHLGGVALSGKVYAVGGQTGETHDAGNTPYVHAYDPATNTWARVADLPAPRSHFHAATFVRNGQVVVVGGESAHNSPSADVFFYDAANDRWGTMTPIPGARRATVAGYVLGKIVVAGGYNGLSHQATTWLGT